MHQKILLKDDRRMYSLLEDPSGSLHMEVIVGGVVMDEVRFGLNTDEALRFLAEGKEYLDDLALRVCRNPAQYRARSG